MRRNPLIIGLLLLLGVVASTRLWVQFGYPLLLKAQEAPPSSEQAPFVSEKIGPHAAAFDYGGNVTVATMTKSKTGRYLPITVMVDINGTPQQVVEILQSTQGLYPVVRIVGLRHDTPSAAIRTLAEMLKSDQVQAVVPDGTLVVFGNELNNLDREYMMCAAGTTCPNLLESAGRIYSGQWSTFVTALQGSRFVPVPAPPDQHNSVYDWATFVKNARGVYGGSLVANVYSTTASVGSDEQRKIGVDLYKALEEMQGGRVVFFTEYGPHPSSSLQEHLDFFLNTPPPVRATTLIPDKCQSKDHNDDLWLYFVDGSIYNKEGVKIDPATCDDGGSGRGEPPDGDYYQRFVYPFYYDDPDNPADLQKEIRQRLADDYTVQCVKPAEYETFLGGTGSINELLNLNNQLISARNCEGGRFAEACLFRPQASLVLTVDGLQNMFGVLRDEREAKWRAYDQTIPENTSKRSFLSRFESVEQWFGANNPSDGEYYDTTPEQIRETHQGPFYKLVDKKMQCIAATEILVASYSLCQDWQQANPNDACPLEKRITGTQHSTFSLLSELTAVGVQMGDAGHRNPGEVVCERFYAQEGEKSAIPSQLMDDILRVDLYMETAYRPAFLVMATEVDSSSKLTDASSTDATIKAQRDGQLIINDSKHIVDFLVYHVPATLSDTSQTSSFSAPDVITSTIQSFVPYETTEKFNAQVQSERDVLRHQLVELDAPDVPAPQIECNRPECLEPLLAALIDMVNVSDAKYGLGCEAQHIIKNAETGSSPGSALAPNDESALLKATKPEDTLGQVEVGVEIQQYYDANGSVVTPRGNPPRTKLFNISPYGYNIVYAAQNLRALMPAEQRENYQINDDYYRGFEAQLGTNFQVAEDARNYYGIPAVVDGELVRDTKIVSGGIKLKDESRPIALQFKELGRVFNHSTRAFTSLVVGHGTALWNCAVNITNPNTNTQDFLRNCSKGGSSGSTPDNSDQTPVNEYLAQEVIPTADCKSFERIGAGNNSAVYEGKACTSEDGPESNLNKPAFIYSTQYGIPQWKTTSQTQSEEQVECNETLYKYVVCTNGRGNTEDGMKRQGNAPALIAHRVNDQGVFDPNGKMTACEYVVKEANARFVSPKLALAMWGEESGFSAFQVADFGVISQPNSRVAGALTQQVSAFLGTVNSHSTYLSFLLSYSGERDKSMVPPVQFCNNREFPAKLHTFYSYFDRTF